MHMIDMNIAKQSLKYAGGALLYIAAVALIMSQIEKIFGDKPDTVLAPVAFLLMLVTSVAMMGMLVFGKPVMLYMDGKKREGATMAMYTIGSLAIFTVLLFLAMALFV